MDSLEVIAFKVPLHVISLHDFCGLIQNSRYFAFIHFRDPKFNLNDFLRSLRVELKSWRKVRNSWNPVCLQFHKNCFAGLLATVGYLSHPVLLPVLNAFSSIFARILLLPSSRSRISNDPVQEFDSTIREFYLLPNANQPVPTTSCQPKGNQPEVICLFT